ncbi:MAG: hypothetical protein AAGK82_15055, partial [Pseudomonadota bacterium]
PRPPRPTPPPTLFPYTTLPIFSHEHSALYKRNTPSGAHDRGYDSAQFGTGVAGRTFTRLQTVCGLVGAFPRDG